MKAHANVYNDFLRGETDTEAESEIKAIISPVEAGMRLITDSTDKRLLKKWKQHLEKHISQITEKLQQPT